MVINRISGTYWEEGEQRTSDTGYRNCLAACWHRPTDFRKRLGVWDGERQGRIPAVACRQPWRNGCFHLAIGVVAIRRGMAFSISLLGQYGIGKTAEASFKLLFAAVIAASVLCVFLFKAHPQRTPDHNNSIKMEFMRNRFLGIVYHGWTIVQTISYSLIIVGPYRNRRKPDKSVFSSKVVWEVISIG